jgi:hypothetical protein
MDLDQARAYLCLFPDRFFGGRWAQIDGTVTVVSLPDAMEPLVGYYRRLAGEHPDGERQVLIRMEITRAGPDRHG